MSIKNAIAYCLSFTRYVREKIVAGTYTCKRWVLRKYRHLFRAMLRMGGFLVAATLLLIGGIYYGIEQPPAFFPLETIITIPDGATVSEVARILKEEQVIRSSLAFIILTRLTPGPDTVLAGDYIFSTPLTLTEVMNRIAEGEFGLEPVRVVIPEGITTYRMATIFERIFPKFDPVAFSVLTEDKEGYLFPDTYLFLPNVTAGEIVTTLEETFYERLRTLESDIAAFGRPIHEIVTMASLLEKEAYNYEQRRKIAGVLWHRIDIGMPLQVDAVFGFIQRGDTFSPKYSDLKVESPYNTYQNTGLPPGPIGNPSLSALKAAVSPIKTDAVFYLHGRDGTLYLARTYAEHMANKRRYLD